MNRVVAYSVLSAELAAYRQLGYDQLVALVGEEASLVRRATDGLDYAVDISVRWGSGPDGDAVVCGSVGPSDWGSPHDRLDDSFIVSKPPSSVA